ncbi:hypothetical protein UlMin_006451 [Ulmus minor]
MDGVAEQERQQEEPSNRKKLGGVKTMPFIFGNEICHTFAMVGYNSNMISYLTQVLNLPLVKASNILTNFAGTANFTPLIGALIADSFAGRFWTITISSLVYQLGMISLTISAVLPSLRPPACPYRVNCVEASKQQLWILYIALFLTSLGSGGIRPNVVTFAADQLDMSKKGVAKRGWNFFSLFFFSLALAALAALIVVVYIQENVGWGWGLGILAIVTAVSIVAFVVGAPLYRKIKPGGSPLVRLVQVIVAAFRKRNVQIPEDRMVLYESSELDAAISLQGRLLHSNQYKWFDRAAIVTAEEAFDLTTRPNLWRIATVHRVEELKCIIRMLPIWATGILLVTCYSHLQSFTVMQARSMDRHLTKSIQIPPASLSIFLVIAMLIGLILYERLFVPIARRITKNPTGITCLQRMGVGFVIHIFATFLSSFVEMRRKQVAAEHNLLDDPRAVIPISVYWLAPQFWLHGTAEVFMAVGNMEFLYDQSPESMRSTAAALYWISISIGNYLGTLMVTLIHKYTGRETNWLPDRNLNRGRLEYYYFLVTGIQIVNFVFYVVCACLYSYKPIDEVSEDSEDEEHQGGDHETV